MSLSQTKNVFALFEAEHVSRDGSACRESARVGVKLHLCLVHQDATA